MKFILFFYCLMHILLEVNCKAVAAPEIYLIPVGQGNCSIIKYEKQVIIVDGGSKEMMFPAVYHTKSQLGTYIYKLEKFEETQHITKQEKSEVFLQGSIQMTFRKRTDRDDSDDSSETDSSLISKISEKKEIIRDSYKENYLRNIRDIINETTINAIVISHGDEDHYNLIEEIFENEKDQNNIKMIILGGIPENYNEDFKTWLKKLTDAKIKVIYSGLANSSTEAIVEFGEWPYQGYARPYCSRLLAETENEKAISSALSFSTASDQTPLTIEILAMNAGNAMEKVPINNRKVKIVRRANRDSNVSSIVLRISYNDRSIIFSGDATHATWDYILTQYFDVWHKSSSTEEKGEKMLLQSSANQDSMKQTLQADYLVISHHGSGDEGATRKDILEIIQPKACFISVGRHKKYHHPKTEVINLLQQVNSLYETDVHAISYYGTRSTDSKTLIHKSKKTKKAIFSTLNSGVLYILLEGNYNVNVTQSKVTQYATGMGRTFTPNYEMVYIVNHPIVPAENQTSVKHKRRKVLDQKEQNLVPFTNEDLFRNARNLIEQLFSSPNSRIFLWEKDGSENLKQLELLKSIPETKQENNLSIIHSVESNEEDEKVEYNLLFDHATKRLTFLDEIEND